jgi:hypothetical protein
LYPLRLAAIVFLTVCTRQRIPWLVRPGVPGGTLKAMPYLAVLVFGEGGKDSLKPSMVLGPLGREMVFGPTPLLSAAKREWLQKNAKSAKQQTCGQPSAAVPSRSRSSAGFLP